jgi:dihydrofolate reductase
MISMIAAMSANQVIGLNGDMPWHLHADLAWFKQNTLNKSIVMGRSTFESIGKPLPHRRNLVLTRKLDRNIAGCDLFDSPEAILADTFDEDEVMITGGSQLYRQFLPLADRLYLTLIDADLQGDTYFPDYTVFKWQEIFREQHQADEKNAHAYTFIILDRLR